MGTYAWLWAGLISLGVASFYADSLAGNQLLVRVVVWKLCEAVGAAEGRTSLKQSWLRTDLIPAQTGHLIQFNNLLNKNYSITYGEGEWSPAQ